MLAEVKSFSLQIGDSICGLDKTQQCILIHITSIKRVSKRTRTQGRYSLIQVRKFESSAAYLGLVARHLIRRENW